MHVIGVVLNFKFFAFVKFTKIVPVKVCIVYVAVGVFRVGFGYASDNGKNGFHLPLFKKRPRKLANTFESVVKSQHNYFFGKFLFSVNIIKKVADGDGGIAVFLYIIEVAPKFVLKYNIFSGALFVFGNVVIHHNGKISSLGIRNNRRFFLRFYRKEKRNAKNAHHRRQNMKFSYMYYHNSNPFNDLYARKKGINNNFSKA